jgi:hypothetical protein
MPSDTPQAAYHPDQELSPATVAERDGLLDALEKAERQREDLRKIASDLCEQLDAAGLALGDSGKWARDAAAEALPKIASIGRHRA